MQGRRGPVSVRGDAVLGDPPGGGAGGWRGVLYHKHPTSARTVFLRIGDEVVVSAPDDAVDAGPHEGRIHIHPASGLPYLAALLDVPPSALRVDGEALPAAAEAADPVWLVELVASDPPAAAAAAAGGCFVSLMEARFLDDTQRTLLGAAYTRILG